MKKILQLFLFSLSSSGLITTVSACTGYDFGGNNNHPTPPQPSVKDINYYQKLMKECETIINDFINNIKELAKYKDDKNLFPTIEDYTKTIAQLKAEQASYQATVYDCQYQILYLQVNGNFNPTAKAQAIIYLQQELIQLNNELTTKKQYASDYDKIELENITKQINTTQTILNSLLKP